MKKTLRTRKQRTTFRLSGCLLLALLLANPGKVLAIASAVITPDGSGAYVIALQNCERLREVALTIDYPPGLGTPAVSPGSIAVLNTINVLNSASTVNLDIIAKKGVLPFAGTLASLTFSGTQDGDPVRIGLSGWATDYSGNRQSLNTWYQGPKDPPKAQDPDADDDEPSAEAARPPAPVPATTGVPEAKRGGEQDRLIGRAGAPVDAKSEPRPSEATPVTPPSPVSGGERSLERGAATGVPLPRVQVIPSVLERFRLFTGDQHESELIRLFETDPASPFRQIPEVALSDGRSKLAITFQLAYPGQEVNVMVMTNARLLSFRYLTEGTRAEMVVLPEAGTYRASLMVKAGDRIIDLPLTVAPPLAPPLVGLGEGDGTLLSGDVNGDGVVDYLDDYILMANRIAISNP